VGKIYLDAPRDGDVFTIFITRGTSLSRLVLEDKTDHASGDTRIARLVDEFFEICHTGL
jgi:hypothetical protein